MTAFQIQIHGRGTESGIGTITKAQYDYWSSEEHEQDLPNALNSDYDYKEHGASPAVVLHEYYDEYEDIGVYMGPDDDGAYITINDPNGCIFAGSLDDFLSETHGDDESIFSATEEVVEMYVNKEFLEAGYYIVWAHGGKGMYFDGLFKAETFNPKLLKFLTTDFDGNVIITEVQYAAAPVENDGGYWRGQWSDYRVVAINE